MNQQFEDDPRMAGIPGPVPLLPGARPVHGPAFFESAQAQRISTTYRTALEKLLGPDWQTSHREVRARARAAAGHEIHQRHEAVKRSASP